MDGLTATEAFDTGYALGAVVGERVGYQVGLKMGRVLAQLNRQEVRAGKRRDTVGETWNAAYQNGQETARKRLGTLLQELPLGHDATAVEFIDGFWTGYRDGYEKSYPQGLDEAGDHHGTSD